MGIALFTISTLFSPLQEFVIRFMPTHKAFKARGHRQALCGDAAQRNDRPPVATQDCPPPRTGTGSSLAAHRKPQLRVVRTIEAGIPAGRTGRMVISGRMSDVCAELERLAAVEAAIEGMARH